MLLTVKYVSLRTPSFIDKSLGKLKSIIFLLEFKSDFSLVMNGEKCISKGLVSKGPSKNALPPACISQLDPDTTKPKYDSPKYFADSWIYQSQEEIRILSDSVTAGQNSPPCIFSNL